MYGDDTIDQLAKILRLKKTFLKHRLKLCLCKVAERYLVEINNIEQASLINRTTYKTKAKWIRSKLLNPIEKILTSLDFDNRHYLSTFPVIQKNLPSFPAIPYIVSELEALHRWSSALEDQFKQMKHGAPGLVERPACSPMTDLTYALVWELLEIYVCILKLDGQNAVPTLISDKESDDGKQKKSGIFAEFIRLTAKKILPNSTELNDEMRVNIKKYHALPRAKLHNKI